MEQNTCGACWKPIYQEPPYPGVASEWRHRSSGQPLSYTPDKHLASPTSQKAHRHVFLNTSTAEAVPCDIDGCGALYIEAKPREPEEPLTERERKAQESRIRGATRGSRRPLRSGPGF